MVENNENLTEQQKDYYRNLILIRKIDKQWIVHCKKCETSLFPFEKNMEREKMDKLLNNHQCFYQEISV